MSKGINVIIKEKKKDNSNKTWEIIDQNATMTKNLKNE